MLTSEKIGNIIPALLAAKQEFGRVIKDKRNDFFNAKYADLEAVLDAVEPALVKHELVLVQQPVVGEDGGQLLCTTLFHTSGEYLTSEWRINPAKPDPQGMGSALTYGRRYTALAMLGIAPEDDDGNAASRQREDKPVQPARDFAKEASEAATLVDLKNIQQAASAAGEWVVDSDVHKAVLARKDELEALANLKDAGLTS